MSNPNLEPSPAAKSPETEAPAERQAIPVSKLTEDIWRDVLKIYFEHAFGGEQPSEQEIEDYLLMMPVEDIVGRQFRIGSRFSHNSKIEVFSAREIDQPSVRFSFYINENLPKQQAKEAEAASLDFGDGVDEYLQSNGLTDPLS